MIQFLQVLGAVWPIFVAIGLLLVRSRIYGLVRSRLVILEELEVQRALAIRMTLERDAAKFEADTWESTANAMRDRLRLLGVYPPEEAS